MRNLKAKNQRSWVSWAMSLILGGGWWLTAGAAAWPQEKAAAGADPRVLDEITVTAERREETSQKAPVAVTALAAEQIEDAGVASVEDAFALVPNMTVARSFTIGNSFVNPM